MAERNGAIGSGSEVVMHCAITLENGTVAESTFDAEPLRFRIGDGTLIEGLESVLYGLGAGDERRFEIAPQDGYGFPDAEAVQSLPRNDFPADMALEPGHIIGFTTPTGEEVPGMVLEVSEDTVKVDFNHPLAGHDLTFDVKILEVRE